MQCCWLLALVIALPLTAQVSKSVASSPSAGKRPNVLVVLTDDQGWGDLSLNGNQNLSTPNIDGLAKVGARFERFFVCPVCSPTRAEFLTGRYHSRSGVYSTSSGGERFDVDERTVADAFQAAGYATGAFGKWHSGMQHPYHPNSRGFDEFYGFCSGHWGDYFSPMLEHNGEIVRGEGFLADDLTDKVMAFMEKNKDRPFFAYLPLNTPHSPMQVPDRFWAKFADKELVSRHREPKREHTQHIRAALAMCENIDWNVGRLLAKLDALGLRDDTIVVYFSDNGPNGFRWNGGMKGRKGSTDEGGVRSPLLVSWPGKIEGGRLITEIGGAIDLLPTLAALADIDVIGDKPLDGLSLKPLLMGTGATWSDRMIFNRWRNRVSVRTQRFRLDAKGRLFDMAADPGQRTDVAAQHPQVSKRLRAAVKQWQRDAIKPRPKGGRPFVIGHAGARLTQMPARDAKTSGGIKRSSRHPNCSYFSEWTSTEDSITWRATVGESGRYRVDLYYACPKADLGSTIELRFGEQRIVGKVAVAHDPALRGAEFDRVKRTESYTKAFASMTLGTMQLDAGPGLLRLRALAIPGGQAMEFRLLMLTRVDGK